MDVTYFAYIYFVKLKTAWLSILFINPFTPKSDFVDLTLSNARRFYSSKGDPLGVKGLMNSWLLLTLNLTYRVTAVVLVWYCVLTWYWSIVILGNFFVILQSFAVFFLPVSQDCPMCLSLQHELNFMPGGGRGELGRGTGRESSNELAIHCKLYHLGSRNSPGKLHYKKCRSMRCMLFMISITKCPLSQKVTKTHIPYLFAYKPSDFCNKLNWEQVKFHQDRGFGL